MKIALGSDHAAFEEKNQLKQHLMSLGHEVLDQGPNQRERCNYPDFATAVSKLVIKENIFGVLLCGSGIGVSMVANRYGGIRAALCRSEQDAELSRQHNDANVLCLGARITPIEKIISITETWLKTEFEGGRHSERISLFNNLGEKI